MLLACGSRQDLVIGSDDFSVVKHDDFDGPSIDLDYWELASHTFDPNLAWFSPANAKLENGALVLSITAVPAPAAPAAGETPKAYSAAELRTRVPFLYGRFRARARLAPGAGIVSSFWGFYDRYAMSSGAQVDNQIVIESGIPKGATTYDLRFAVKVPTAGVEPTGQPSDVDPTRDFHVIGYDWTPTEVRFFFDGASKLVVTGDAATQLTQYERLVLSAYPSGATWLGDFDPKQLPLTAEFDWVEIAAYRGPRP
jgi:beta-glucanase (GH16 family)